jgi:tetratricopeptide (TPR) repeat protein
LWALLRQSARTAAQEALGKGDFQGALAALTRDPGRDELLAAAMAAKHLWELDRARELLSRLLAADPADGEAWLERGLVEAYAGDAAAAREAFARVEPLRADLAESLTLHRAWLELVLGEETAARRRFEQIAAPLETKLRTDLGSGEPVFAEWFLHAAALWEAAGQRDLAEWARAAGLASAPASRLARHLGTVRGAEYSATIDRS